MPPMASWGHAPLCISVHKHMSLTDIMLLYQT